jgi:hypothetical protein
VFENRVLRRIFDFRGMKQQENRESFTVGSFIICTHPQISNIIRQIKSMRIRWVRHVARMAEERKLYKVLVGKPKGKRALGKLRHRWKDGIKMDVRETGWQGVESIHLAYDRDW